MQKTPKEIAHIAKQYKSQGMTWDAVTEKLNAEGYKTMSNGAYTRAYVMVLASKFGSKRAGTKARRAATTNVTGSASGSLQSVKTILKTFVLSNEDKKSLAVYLLTA